MIPIEVPFIGKELQRTIKLARKLLILNLKTQFPVMSKFRILSIFLLVGATIIVFISIFKRIDNKEVLNLQKLIEFQRCKNPLIIDRKLRASGEWTGARNALLEGVQYRAFTADGILFNPISNFDPVLIYMTPDREAYSEIMKTARMSMEVKIKKTINGEPAFDFVNHDVAIQAGFARDHFVVLVMSRKDYDSGLRLA